MICEQCQKKVEERFADGICLKCDKINFIGPFITALILIYLPIAIYIVFKATKWLK